MNKPTLIEHYRAFLATHHLTSDQVVLGCGGALCLLGLREETADLDVDVPADIFKRLLAMDYPTHYYAATRALVIKASDVVDVHLRANRDPVLVAEGVSYYAPQVLLAFKRRLNRAKDQADIQALEAYLTPR